MPQVTIRAAKPKDVGQIEALMSAYVNRRILLGKERVVLYESIQEFLVAESSGEIVGCGALHVMWEHLAEVRTLVVSDAVLGLGVGHALLEALIARACELELSQIFCLTFETEFFARHGFVEMAQQDSLDTEVYMELLRSPDDGVAEFLDLARVKPNTLGNTRMLLTL